jgi:glutamate/tyrosine decarboxylase-like PLP-dependent enzyme
MDPIEHQAALDLAREAAERYLADLATSPVHEASAEAALEALSGSLPESGMGALAALRELIERGLPAAIRGNGPRMFHFVTGGVTPAALAADWLTSAIDQSAFSWVNSPLATRLEAVALRWLRELLDLPAEWGGVLVTGATMANFTGLAAARHWWADRHGVDVEELGMAHLPQVPVLSSGFIHASSLKALAMLGIGRGSVGLLAVDGTGRLDLEALEEALRRLDGAPAIVVANAGEVNTGAFDPIEAMADLAERHGAWLHVDGAFGLFARVAPETAPRAAGIERANSVAADGHKWLNVAYDCGFAFVRDAALLGHAFGAAAAYLPDPDDQRLIFGFLGPEMSRRARAIPLWATLAAYGRDGYREMVARHHRLALRLAATVDGSDDFERLAEVPLDIVCFRYRPPGIPANELDALNARLGASVLEDGRVFVGTTRYDGRTCFRPAIANWLTREPDVDLIVSVMRELGSPLARRQASG